jgi:hypothetical protein
MKLFPARQMTFRQQFPQNPIHMRLYHLSRQP